MKRRKIFTSIKNELNKDHKGVVAFEYVIILVIMAVAIFGAWELMSEAVIEKGGDIAAFIRSNGQDGLNGTPTNP